MAVVDDELRVHGLEGLRVIDASIMPAVSSTNTNAAQRVGRSYGLPGQGVPGQPFNPGPVLNVGKGPVNLFPSSEESVVKVPDNDRSWRGLISSTPRSP
jgi:hypothetical protein